MRNWVGFFFFDVFCFGLWVRGVLLLFLLLFKGKVFGGVIKGLVFFLDLLWMERIGVFFWFECLLELLIFLDFFGSWILDLWMDFVGFCFVVGGDWDFFVLEMGICGFFCCDEGFRVINKFDEMGIMLVRFIELFRFWGFNGSCVWMCIDLRGFFFEVDGILVVDW